MRSVENLQREDLHAIEQAREYQALLALTDDKGQPVHTIKTLAERIGKSEAWIYGRLKLLRMPPVAQEAYLSGKLNDSVALLLCRIPDPKMAYKATLEVLDRYGQGITPEREKRALDPNEDAMSFRQAKYHLQDHYMIRLKGAKFDQKDENLVPTVWRASNGETDVLVTCLTDVMDGRNPVGVTPPKIPAGTTSAHVGDVTFDDGESHKRTVYNVISGKFGESGKVLAGPVNKATAEALAALVNAGKPITIERTCGGSCEDCPFRTGMLKKLWPALYADVESADVCTNTACYKAKVKAAQKEEQQKYKEKGQVLLSENQTRSILNMCGSEPTLTSEARARYIDLREKVPGKRITWEEALEAHLPEDARPAVARTGKKNLLLLDRETAEAAAKAAGLKLPAPPKCVRPYEEAQQREERCRVLEEIVAQAVDPLVKAAIEKRKTEELLRFMLEDRLEDDEFKATEKMDVHQLVVTLFRLRQPDAVSWQGELQDYYIEFCKEFGVDAKKLVAEAQKQRGCPTRLT